MRATQFYLLVGSLVAASPGIAQTAAPRAAPAASSAGGMGWLWILLLLVVVGGAVWYFLIRSKRSVTSTGMDRDRVAGSAEYAKGSVKESVGSVLGDTKIQAEGKLDKAQGRTQNTVGGIKDTLRGK